MTKKILMGSTLLALYLAMEMVAKKPKSDKPNLTKLAATLGHPTEDANSLAALFATIAEQDDDLDAMDTQVGDAFGEDSIVQLIADNDQTAVGDHDGGVSFRAYVAAVKAGNMDEASRLLDTHYTRIGSSASAE